MDVIQNIKNNSTRSIQLRAYNDKYFDYMLYRGEVDGANNLSDITIADFSCPFDMEDNVLYSTTTWKDAVNNGVFLEDIGFTGTDNGFISFRKDRISNKDYLDILTRSTFQIEENDMRFFMSPVTGNTLNFNYPMTIETSDNDCHIAFKGGFYQGFYKLHGFDYQVLPNTIDNEWCFYFQLRPRSDYEVGVRTVNHIHPENKGIFFFMGTRAENKFWSLYKTEKEVTDELKRIPDDNNYTNGELCGEESDSDFTYNHVTKSEYLKEEPEEIKEEYFRDGYTISASTEDCPCIEKEPEYIYDENGFGTVDSPCTKGKKCCNEKHDGHEHDGCASSDCTFSISDIYDYKYRETSNCCTDGNCCGECNKKKEPSCQDSNYKEACKCDTFWQDGYYDDQCWDGPKAIEDDYIEQDAVIDENNIEDSFGHMLNKKGYYEIESDNKFLMFDRTKDGFTVHNWIEGTKVTLTGRQDWSNINYFPIMNRTKTGYTVDNIYQYNEENSIPYNIYKDIKNNAFGLRITDNGSIGYRYAILDCEAENDQHYSVVEEYSKENIVKTDEWNDIVVKIRALTPKFNNCDARNRDRKMKLYFYVNGFLILVSKELPMFNFKELNDTYQKQEAVPYNISLGGGTQGLLESILPDYYNTPDYILPIEKSFCGTFLGDIKSFKIIDGAVNYLTVKKYLSVGNHTNVF